MRFPEIGGSNPSSVIMNYPPTDTVAYMGTVNGGKVVIKLDGEVYEFTPRQAMDVGTDMIYHSFIAFHNSFLDEINKLD